MTWADLTHSELAELVSLIIIKRHHKAKVNKFAWEHSRMRPYFRSLRDKGLITKVSESKQYITFTYTEAALAILRDMPDKLPGDHFFPIEQDIRKMKTALAKLA